MPQVPKLSHGAVDSKHADMKYFFNSKRHKKQPTGKEMLTKGVSKVQHLQNTLLGEQKPFPNLFSQHFHVS